MSDTHEHAAQGVPNDDTASQPATETAPLPGTEQPSEDQGQKAADKPLPDPRDRAIRRTAYDLREARREIEQLREQVRVNQPKPDPNTPPAPADIDRLVQERAEHLAAQKVEQQRATQQFQAFVEAGASEMGNQQFDDACNALADMGAVENPAFMSAVLRLPQGHRVVAALAANPAEATRVLALPPLDLALELAALSHKATAPTAPKAVSQAPPPIKPLGGSGRTEPNLSEMSGDEYLAYYRKRRGSRS